MFVLKDEHNKKYYQYLYGDRPVLINTTKDVMGKFSKINEKMFLELINEYYMKIKELQSDDESEELLSHLFNLEFKTLQDNFKLIKEDYKKVDVFIELDNDAKIVWQKYQVIKSIKNPRERKEKFLKIKRQFYEYVISIPEKYAAGLVNENQEIGYVPQNEIDLYYDLDTGFKRDSAGSGALIC